MMSHWTFGTLVRTEKTSGWRIWNTDYEPKQWKLKV